ncbi:putative PAS/PAC sensor protein [Chthoniobacter flavus Ellin428]|uniref:histidine kinase n=1 Tax=Chthoniobacter flavus Ellin428 TaxID=497964 RepID=B4D6V1_9BACT|nr:putative PAS/PAC sensor protein [Chthoniobacter flavus Ellin428]
MGTKLFDKTIVSDAVEAVDFIGNILESSTEYSIIGKDLNGKILLWNEGARRLYGYEPEEVVGKANSQILHTAEDVAAGKPQQMLEAALHAGKWEGTIARRRKNGQQFMARVVVTPRRDGKGRPIGYLLISKDVTNEVAFSEELRRAKLFDSAIVGNAQEAVDFITNILESSTEYSVIGKDLDGKILLWNEGARRLYGYEPEEVVGKANSSMLHVPEDVQAGLHQEIMAAALRDGKWEGTLVRARKNGQRFTARVVITPRRDSSGKAIGYLLISKDISAEIRLTEELKATQFYARSLIEASLDPLVTISPEGKITDVNEASVQVTGVAREKLVGTDFSDYFTEPDKAREGYQQVFSQGFVRDYPLAIRHTSGRITDVLYNASVYKDDKGNVLGVFAAARDVTAQKQASRYARSLIEASLDPLVTISPEGKITDVNETSVEATGVPREKLVGTDFSDYFTEPDKAREGYQQVFSQGFVRDYPLAIRHTSGRITDVLYNASVYKDDKGNVLGVFAAARDVTERKQAEAKQRASSAYARSLIEASVDPLVTISPDGKITDVNRATELATGIPRQRLTGTDFSDYFTEPEKAREGYQQVFFARLRERLPAGPSATPRAESRTCSTTPVCIRTTRTTCSASLRQPEMSLSAKWQRNCSAPPPPTRVPSLKPRLTRWLPSARRARSPMSTKRRSRPPASCASSSSARTSPIISPSRTRPEPATRKPSLKASCAITPWPSAMRPAGSWTCSTTPACTKTIRARCSVFSPRRATSPCRNRRRSMRAV